MREKSVLEGIRVIDCTIMQAGPVAGMFLGELGAQVIHIEEPGRGDPLRGLSTVDGVPLRMAGGRGATFEYYNRNKMSMTVNLKKQQGREIIYRLVEKSDVFLTNLREEFIAKNALDYEALSKYNNRLIYAISSGYGPKGPVANWPALDYSLQAMSGLMTSSGDYGGPPVFVNVGVCDQVNAIFLAKGVLAALLARERFGIGQKIVVSQLSSVMALQGLAISVTLGTRELFRRHDRKASANPLWNMYKCKDGRWIVLCILQADKYWGIFCQAIGMPELEKDDRFSTQAKRAGNSEALVSILDRTFAMRTCEEWTERLSKARLTFSPVKYLNELEDDPQVLANKYIVDFNHPVMGKIKVLGHPIDYFKTPATISCAPECGEHTEKVLTEILGYSWDDISKLSQQGVI